MSVARRVCVATVTLMAAAWAMAAQVALFPGVASVGGQNNTVWNSEVFLRNTSDASQQVLFEIIPRDGATVVASRTYSLVPAEDLRIADLYAALQAPSGAGSLRVTGDVITWVRTFNQSPQGTFGQGIPGGGASRFEEDETALFPIHNPTNLQTEFRSNLIILSLHDFVQTVHVSVGNATRDVELQPGVFTQVGNVGAWVGAARGEDGTLAVVSNGVWAGYVSTIDPGTGDPTTVVGAPWLDHFLYEPFDIFAGWTYTPDSYTGSSFRATGGVLSAATFGPDTSGWHGPAAIKPLAHTIDIGLQDFALEAAVVSSGGGGYVHLYLTDQDGTTIAGFSLESNGGYFNLYAEGEDQRRGMHLGAFAGKVTLLKAEGQYSLHFNDGPELLTLPQVLNRVVTGVKLILKTNTPGTPPDMKIDWIRVSRR